MTHKKTLIHGTIFAYQDNEKQSEKTLVFLHGWACSGAIFAPLFPFFESKYRIITVDFPGFGQSELPENGLNIQEYSERLHALMQKLEIENPVFITHSFGGRVALDYAARFPENTHSLVLINSGGIKNTSWKIRWINWLAKTGKALGLHLFKNLFYTIFIKEEDAAKLKDSPALKKTFQSVVQEDLQDRAANIHCPVLLLWGESDASTPLWQGKRWHQLLPQSQLFTHSGDHFFFLDDPQWVARKIMDGAL